MSRSKHSALVFLLALMALIAASGPAFAGIEFVSTPSAAQTTDGDTAVFENTRFEFSSQERPVSFHFSGESSQPWDENDYDSSNAALDYAYIKLRSRLLKTDFSLGRLQPDNAITTEMVDGMYSRTNISKTSQLSFFLGKTADSGYDVMGGTFWYGPAESRAGGISYFTESDGAGYVRQEAAVNVRLRPLERVLLSGRSLLDLDTGSWTEHSYSARIGPFHDATFLLDASLVNYESPDTADRIPAAGAGIRYRLSSRFAVGFDVRRIEDPFAGSVVSGGAHLSYRSLRNWNAGVSVVRRQGRYLDALEISAHASRQFGNLESSLDLRRIAYDADSDKNSSSAELDLAYQLTREYRLVAEMQELRDPDARGDFRGFLKLEYRFGS